MSVCKSIRHYSWAQLGSFRQTAVVARARKPRSVTTTNFTPSLRVSCCPSLSQNFGSSTRHYWWSSRSTTTPTSENSQQMDPGATPSDQIITPLNSPNGTSSDELTSTLAASEQVVPGETILSSVPELPLDAIPPSALQLGDLKELGFSNFTPVGAAQAALEFIQVTTGLPWWGTITLTTVLARVAILYFTVQSTRANARMAPLRPQMQKLMEEATAAKASRDKMRLQVAALKLQKLRKDNGFGIGASLAGPLSQAVLSISMFIGIKKLCDFPLAQLKFESFAWLPSLTAPDPYYILPALSLALMNLQIQLGKAEMAAGGEHMLHFANGFRVLGLVFFPVVANLPSGLLLHLFVNIATVALQTSVLRIPSVRRALDIPPIATASTAQSPSMRDSWDALVQYIKKRKLEAVQQAQERAELPQFPAHPSAHRISTSAVRRQSKREVSRSRKH